MDLALSKVFDVRYARMSVRADVLNVFNTVNYGGFDGWIGGPGTANRYGGDNPNTGVPNSMYGRMRTVKLTFSANF